MKKSAGSVLLVLLTVLICMPSCKSIQKQDEDPMREVKEGALKGFEQLSEKARSTHSCIIGVRPDASGVIMYVGTRAKGTGIMIGDQILAVDGKPTANWVQAKEKIRQRQAGETLTLRLLRDGSTIDLQCPCSDVGQALFGVADALYEASEGNWLECSAKIDRVQQEFGPSTLAQNVLLDCYKYHLMSEKKGPDKGFARALQQVVLLTIEDAAYSKPALQEIRPWLLSQIEWLKSNNYPQLADEVEQKYQAALQRF